MLQYAYVYNDTPQAVIDGSPIAFNGINQVLSSGITHTPGSTLITLLNSGTYEVTFIVTATTAGQWQVALSLIPQTQALYGTAADGSQVTGTVILTAVANDTISIFNPSGSPRQLPAAAGGPNGTVNASVMITQVA